MNDYAVSKTVITSIEIECRRNPENETGGILVGSTLGSTSFVTHCSGPGVIWSSSSHHFTKDTDYMQQVLNLLYEYFGVNYLGLWHKHPIEYPSPSGIDISNAMTEISESNIGLYELLTPVCFLKGDIVRISPFVIRDGDAHMIDWKIVPYNHMSTVGLLDRNWYDAPVGKDRLRDEIRKLENYNLDVVVGKGEDERYRIRVSNKKRKAKELVFLCPVDYPVSSPNTAILDKGTGLYLPVSSNLLADWNLYRSLCDIALELDFV